MALWQNIPFFCIIACLFGAAVCSMTKSGRGWSRAVVAATLAAHLVLLACFLLGDRASYTFMMGHFPAPWGNEIRVGALEIALGTLFALVMLCSLGAAGPKSRLIPDEKIRLMHTAALLLMAALFAQVYSNDLFTCYVFLEIMTLTACALIIARGTGNALAAGTRYMVLNLVGSGLFLFGLVILYTLTGHLLMENLRESVQALMAGGTYHRALVLSAAMMTVGLCVKSALFPFHAWVPDAYSAGLPESDAILSSLVSKGYIVLVMKLYIRVLGADILPETKLNHLLFVCAAAGIIFGSLEAVRSGTFFRMIAWSSVCQIGYIYLGISMGQAAGYEAAVYHLMVHAVSKSLLFLSGEYLRGNSDRVADLRGSARSNPYAGVCWTVAAFSMVGLPFTGGMISKVLLGNAAMSHSAPVAIAAIAVLVVSTLLNILYFLRTVIRIWSPGAHEKTEMGISAKIACGTLALMIVAAFFGAGKLVEILIFGLEQF